MARYRIGETPTPGGTDPVTATMLTGAAVFGLLIGIGFVIAGMRARQYWLSIWGGGLVLSSIAYLISPIFW